VALFSDANDKAWTVFADDPYGRSFSFALLTEDEIPLVQPTVR
jgi:hypothetical protein